MSAPARTHARIQHARPLCATQLTDARAQRPPARAPARAAGASPRAAPLAPPDWRRGAPGPVRPPALGPLWAARARAPRWGPAPPAPRPALQGAARRFWGGPDPDPSSTAVPFDQTPPAHGCREPGAGRGARRARERGSPRAKRCTDDDCQCHGSMAWHCHTAGADAGPRPPRASPPRRQPAGRQAGGPAANFCRGAAPLRRPRGACCGGGQAPFAADAAARGQARRGGPGRAAARGRPRPHARPGTPDSTSKAAPHKSRSAAGRRGAAQYSWGARPPRARLCAPRPQIT